MKERHNIKNMMNDFDIKQECIYHICDSEPLTFRPE